MKLVKISSSILRKFLIFNFLIFLVLGLFTFFYLQAIQPNLVKQRTEKHTVIIGNTSNHIERLKINFEEESLKNFLLSTRFLFQNLERVQFYNRDGKLIGDSNVLDLDQNVFSKSDTILEENINEKFSPQDSESKNKKLIKKKKNENIENLIKKKNNDPIVLQIEENNNFYVKTLDDVTVNGQVLGYIMVTEQANEILTAVEERRNFILRTVFAIGIAVFIFSIFLNRYILKPIASLVRYTESIQAKDESFGKIEKFLYRSDELGLLSRSLNNMTKDLQKRTRRAENSSADLAHEIRNPLASLKGASELLETTSDQSDRKKLIEILSHDVSRIDRLITDYSQMLKDEASLSREKMKTLNLEDLIKNIVEEFNNNPAAVEKNIKFKIIREKLNGKDLQLAGIWNRLEQVFANCFANAVSFSPDNGDILVNITSNKDMILIKIKDEGPGFTEGDTEKIFGRFYSNRPKKFGEHSGLGLNIVKSIVEMHEGKIKASNRSDGKNGAEIELQLPRQS
jgi:two-component system sensor histidine kinase ChvG